MWQSEELLNHIETSSSIKSRPFVTSEWNLNISSNIAKIGNYRYRPYERLSLSIAEQSQYSSIQNGFDVSDEGLFYTDATDSDVVVDGGYTDSSQDTPAIFKSKRNKENLLYSLEDCFSRFRPRSGVNKLRYLETDSQYIGNTGSYVARRPRFYMSHKDDKFKYWTSYRFDNGTERGIANHLVNGNYYIDDAAPFIVYKDRIPVNRIVVKMQTGVGDIDLGPFSNNAGSFDDPFFGQQNMSRPVRWSIQYLENNNWLTAMSFDENSIRSNDFPIIGPDGYVEIYYGLKIPIAYSSYFKHAGEFSDVNSLPSSSIVGYAYLVGASETSAGQYYVWDGQGYNVPFTPEYGWQIKNDGDQNDYGFISNLNSPDKFINPLTAKEQYRELQYISGLRIVVDTMNKNDAVFDLIELSPRLSIDITDRITSFTLKKPASDLGVSGLPVGQLLAGTGSMSLFDYDLSFSSTNQNSIISKFATQNMQIKFYEVIENVNGYDYYLPVKTMYSDGFPDADNANRTLSISLRDLYFYFESMTAPQLFLSDVSLSLAVSILLDSIGFTNYVFYRLEDEADPIIPNFVVKPEESIAKILSDLAISTQHTMFFDEYNNFIIMSRNYIMPEESQRQTDIVMYGSKDYQEDGQIKNKPTSTKLSNIIEIASQSNKVFNGGQIQYTSRYIQKTPRMLSGETALEQDQVWVYSVAELWNVASEKQARITQNGTASEGAITLEAMPLNSDLNDKHPYVSNNTVYNNTIDVGEAIHFISKYQGYLYANSEIIKYDAIQYSIPGLTDSGDDLVWITSSREYEKYFSSLAFNGKMYATGLLRIYSEPYYETINGITRMQNGMVAKSGRCQFGTGELNSEGDYVPVYHYAGISSYWIDNSNVRGVRMASQHLFSGVPYRSSEYLITSIEVYNKLSTIGLSSTHSFVVGDTIYIESLDPSLDGKHVVSQISESSFSFLTDIEDIEATPVENIFAKAYITKYDSYTSTVSAGPANDIGIRSSRNGIIKNYLSNSIMSENDAARLTSTQSGTLQSSALVFSGGTYLATESPVDYVSYIHKPLNNAFKHFGTRLRIVGKQENDELRLQTPVGVMKFYGVQEPIAEQLATIGGASAGVAVMIDEAKNTGYYFEIAALTADNIASYANSSEIHDVIFYKVVGANGQAIPVKLWGGYSGIITDTGTEVGQARVVAEENPSVYDLAVEYEDIGSTRRFYLYLNNSLIQIVDDENPLPKINSMALFIRGGSRAMFENVYAITNNYSQNTAASLNLPAKSIFGGDRITSDQAFRKYAISGIVQSSFLSSISSSEPPAYSMYYDEFGTIMREAMYFDVRYDKAYPALAAYLAPTFSKVKGYVVSGFMAGAYGAEFLLFNATDSRLLLDGEINSLRIIGITFTQENNVGYSVDDYFDKISDFSKVEMFNKDLITSPDRVKEEYFEIKSSRIQYGRNDFNLTLPYLQSASEAESLMQWLVNKIMKPRMSLGIKIFPNPMIQLGDIISINYNDETGNPVVIDSTSRFVVYNIDYERDSSGPSMHLYLSEVK